MRTLQILILTTCFFFTILNCSFAQSKKQFENKSIDIGLEVQVYPTGIIPGIRLEKYLNSNSSINLRLGYQIIDHRDLGVQNDEVGSGYGVSIAYRRFFNSYHKDLSLAFRTDLWFNKIEWESNWTNGVSNITVVQPTIMGEYAFRISREVTITPSLSFGWEWNVSSDGAPTGEGAIILIGCTFGFGL